MSDETEKKEKLEQPVEESIKPTDFEETESIENLDSAEANSIEDGEATWEEKANEYLTDLKRSQADFENYKKRMAAGQAELSAHLTRGIVTDLIPILDNFHAAITHVPKESEGSPWVTGITYIEKQFEDVLANYGVKPIDVKVGDAFDPTKHEALSHEEKTADEKKDETKGHTISKVVQKGYQIGDTIVRAAKVIVK